MRRRRVLAAGAVAGGAVAYHYGKQRGQEPDEGEQAYAPDQGTAYAPPASTAPPAPPSDADELQQLAQLHTSGVLTDAEFTAAKNKVLSS
jgi:hypothetical protein